MSAQRRRADRESTESVKRMWQSYADQMGVPQGRPAESNGSPSQHTEDPASRGRPVSGMTVTLKRRIPYVSGVMVIAGIALWLGPFGFLDRANRRLPTPGSAPTGQVDQIAQRAAQSRRAGDPRGALAPAVPSSTEKNDRFPRPIQSDATGSRPIDSTLRSGVPRHETTQARGTPSAEAKHTGANVTYRINFDAGSGHINEMSKPTLDKLIVAMQANPEWRTAIEGHTDAQGSPDYNQALSERRAHAVKAYLQLAGISPGRLRIVGYGSSRPVAPNDAQGNVLNRRVELHRW